MLSPASLKALVVAAAALTEGLSEGCTAALRRQLAAVGEAVLPLLVLLKEQSAQLEADEEEAGEASEDEENEDDEEDEDEDEDEDEEEDDEDEEDEVYALYSLPQSCALFFFSQPLKFLVFSSGRPFFLF